MLRRILLFIAVLAVPLSLIAVSALPARADETPPTLSPAQGPPGAKVTASAADWPGCSSMSVSAWGTTLGTTTISAAGAFSLTFTVPSNAPAGATQLQFSPTCTHSTYIPFVTFTVTKVTTGTPPVPVITSVGTYTRGVLVYFDIHYADPGHDAAGFGFVGVNGSGWAEENHPFSSPSYGIVGPGSIAYPFNEACGTAQQYASYVEAWIYDTAGNRSKPVVIHLVCTTTPTGNGTSALQLPFPAGETWWVCQGYNGQISHKGIPALDLTVRQQDVGTSGCYGDTNASANRSVTAPGSGTAIPNGPDGVCLNLDSGKSMWIGHLIDRVSGKVEQGGNLGKVEPANSRSPNGGYAHIHVEIHPGLGCATSGAPIPFDDAHGTRFAGAPNMPYDGTVKNQYSGQALTRP